MPTYEFACEKCKKHVEEFQRITQMKPPICCEQAMKNVISAGGGYILKGSGWAGQEITRANEDAKVVELSKKARDLKSSGAVRMEDHLDFKDVERLSS